MSAPRQMLVVGPSWVGDMVMAQTLFMHLRATFPDMALDVLAPGWSLPLLRRMPEIRSAVDLGVGHGEIAWGKRRALGRRLRRCAYDRAIVLPRSFKAALVPAFAGIPIRTGFLGEYRYGLLNDIRPFDKRELDQTVKRFLALSPDGLPKSIPQPVLRLEPERAVQLCQRFGIDATAPRIALAPGAEYGSAKRWPAEHFARLARRLVSDGYVVLVLGSDKEAALGAEIAVAAESGQVFNLCGQTQLVDAIDLLGTARAGVCNDSGLLHVAAAAGTPVVAIYGSSTPEFTPPLTQRAQIVYEGLPCSPCFKRECPLGHLNCLRQIGPEHVAAQIGSLISRCDAA